MQEVKLYTMDMFQEYKKNFKNHIDQFLLLMYDKMTSSTLLFMILHAMNTFFVLAIPRILSQFCIWADQRIKQID